MKKLANDCFLHDKDRMRHDEAIDLLRSRMSTIVASEEIALADACGRIAAADVVAPRNIPAFDNSAVDGYAFSHSQYTAANGDMPITLRIAAGDTELHSLGEMQAARIFTGARMPDHAETVAMQEDCEIRVENGVAMVRIPAGLKFGANCRLAGEDVSSGETVVETGTLLRPQEIAAIASTGAAQVSVFRKLHIGILSSGDEILKPGAPFEQGKVYDSNRYLLHGLLDNPVFEIDDLGVCPDDEAQVRELLSNAAGSNDAVLSTGGASRGEEDHFVSALDALGNCHLWQLAVKPGRPMSFGQINQTPCFVLPGNPVAAFVCFALYVRPALTCLAGGQWQLPDRFPLPAGFSLRSKPDRREFLRGFLDKDSHGKTVIRKFPSDGSGLISGLRAASGLIEVDEDTTSVDKGQPVNFLPFSGLLG